MHTSHVETPAPPAPRHFPDSHDDDCVFIKGYVIPRDVLTRERQRDIDPSWLDLLAIRQ